MLKPGGPQAGPESLSLSEGKNTQGSKIPGRAYKPVTVEGKRLPGEVHLLQLLLITPAGVLHSQVDVAGVGAGCVTEDPGRCLPHADAHLLSLYA